MQLRKYKPEDCAAMTELFFNTVHAINAKDYTTAQLKAWATGKVDLNTWNQSFLEHYTIVAEVNGIIAGFGDMDNLGYLDKLFVHKDYQNIGIATAIVNELEHQALLSGISHFTTHASITAKPFFEKRGYRALQENTVIRKGIKLINFIMEKNCGNELP